MSEQLNVLVEFVAGGEFKWHLLHVISVMDEA